MDFLDILVFVLLAIIILSYIIARNIDPTYFTQDEEQVEIEELDFEGSKNYNRYKGIKAIFKRAYKSKDD